MNLLLLLVIIGMASVLIGLGGFMLGLSTMQILGVSMATGAVLGFIDGWYE